MQRRFLILFFLIAAISSNSQTKIIDSLKQYVYHSKNDADKLKATLDLCEEHRSLDRDTLSFYADMAKRLVVNSNDKRAIILSELAMANTQFRWGWMDSAIKILDPVLKRTPVTDPALRDLHFKMARQEALYYGGKSKYPEALTILYQIVNDAEKYKDSITLAANINTIGSIALQRSAPAVALEQFHKALSYATKTKAFVPVRAAIYVNTAEAYKILNELDSADFYIGKGIILFKEVENLSNLAQTLQRQADIFIRQKKMNQAEASLKEMIEVRKKTSDGAMWVDDNLSLMNFYILNNKVDSAIAFLTNILRSGDLYDTSYGKGVVFANNIDLRITYYQELARCYKIAQNNELYQQTLEQIIAAKDSFYMANSEVAIAEVQTKYEVQKKENTIIQQQFYLSRKNYQLYFALGLLCFAAIITYILFASYRKREKLKMQNLLDTEKLISAQAVAHAEEGERKRIAADLHDNLGAYAASIASNLAFIKTEKRDPQSDTAMQELNNNSQSMVSELSDTIWALNKNALTLTAISDRVKVFVKRVQPSYPKIEIEVRESISHDPFLQPTQAFHLFRIIQEAVNNAMKHSGATSVIVLFEAEENWNITVADNGKGMPEDRRSTTGGGNGLLNMRMRADASGWNIEWHDNKPTGTLLVIKPTTN